MARGVGPCSTTLNMTLPEVTMLQLYTTGTLSEYQQSIFLIRIITFFQTCQFLTVIITNLIFSRSFTISLLHSVIRHSGKVENVYITSWRICFGHHLIRIGWVLQNIRFGLLLWDTMQSCKSRHQRRQASTGQWAFISNLEPDINTSTGIFLVQRYIFGKIFVEIRSVAFYV